MSDNYSVAPSGPRKTKSSSSSSGSSGGSSSGGSGGSSGGSSSGGGGGGGGGNPYLREQKKAQRRAADRYRDQAAALQQQVRAWSFALNSGFKDALDRRLANINLVQRQQDKVIVEGYRDRVRSLRGANQDNEKAESDQSYANIANRGRERSSAISEAMLQGAGESDMLRSQSMALRNWNANQSEVNRSYFDTLRTVNSSLTDLNIDTKTARMNIASEANADREQLWTNYFGQRSEAYTQLGNIKGQQAELYGLANEQVASKDSDRRRKRSEKQSGAYFMDAAKATGTAWKNPGAPKRLRNWDGVDLMKGRQNQSRWINRTTIDDEAASVRRPEGATLREW